MLKTLKNVEGIIMKHFSRFLFASAMCAVCSAPQNASAWADGVQFGLGVSASSGLNGFIGYANKDFESFWWKRLGIRFDFARTSPIKSWMNSGIDSIVGDKGIEIDDSLTIQNIELKIEYVKDTSKASNTVISQNYPESKRIDLIPDKTVTIKVVQKKRGIEYGII